MSPHLTDRLPAHLRERVFTVADRPPAGGELVLYWMHHAVRGHENPALDTACLLAAALELPLLVYPGLGGRHPYNADRHHWFILEGARDAHRDLAERGIRAVFHLPTDPTAPSLLGMLAAHAALVVTEDFPVPPFRRWTAALALDLAADLDVVSETMVTAVRRDGDGWLLEGSHRRALGRWDRVLVAVPAPKAAALLASVPDLARQCATARYAPCWAVLVEFEEPPALPWDAARPAAGPLVWVAHDGSKPGRAGRGWVLHATPEWSFEHLEDDPGRVVASLLASLAPVAAGRLPEVHKVTAHRWRSARVINALGTDCLWDGATGLGAAGDWCRDHVSRRPGKAGSPSAPPSWGGRHGLGCESSPQTPGIVVGGSVRPVVDRQTSGTPSRNPG